MLSILSRGRRSVRVTLLFALLLAAALLLAQLSTRGSLAYHSLRLSASFLGFGWCDPTEPTARRYAFSGAEGPSLTWENDAEFWSVFPCARSQYRIWLPEAPSAAAPPPPPRDCSSLTVTAFFDIGRAQWTTYSRPLGEYLANAATVLATRNAMVIFTSPELAEGIIAARRAHGLMDRTLVVGLDVHCAPEAWSAAAASKLVCTPAHWAGNINLGIPERQQPWYNVVMWMKATFVSAAATLPQPELRASWVTWLDLGCHGPMCFEELRGSCVDPAPWAPRDRLRIAQVNPVSDRLAAYTPVEFIGAHHVTFAGTIFGTARENARAAMDFFRDTVAYLLARGVADTDQTVFHYMFLRRPEAFAPYQSFFDDWNGVVRGYLGPAAR